MIEAVVDTTTNPLTLTVNTGALRRVEVTVTVIGQAITATGTLPITATDDERTWTLETDDGTTAVYRAPLA